MDLNYDIIKGEVEGCYNSLIIDVKLVDGSIVPAFCSSSEAIALCRKNMEVGLKRTTSTLRKLRYELEYISRSEGLIFVNQSYNRRLFLEAFKARILKDFVEYPFCREIEPADHLQHIDFELKNKRGDKCYVFMKTVYNKTGGYSVFPSGINFFELEMFEEMGRLRAAGHKTVVFILVPRQDCTAAKFSWNMDPIAAAKIYDEAKNGLDFVCYGCNLSRKSVSISTKMNIIY